MGSSSYTSPAFAPVFTPTEETIIDEEAIKIQSSQIESDLLKLKVKDHTWRIEARDKYAQIFVGLLIAQNIAVFFLVYLAYALEDLKEVGTVLSVLVTATLIETGYIIKIIVQWIFSDIDYKK